MRLQPYNRTNTIQGAFASNLIKYVDGALAAFKEQLPEATLKMKFTVAEHRKQPTKIILTIKS